MRRSTYDCSDCEGTGIGRHGLDSRCSYCSGRGYHYVVDDDDGPETLDYDGPMPGDGNYLED